MLFWRSIERIIDIWEFMHPTKTLVIVFDNSSGHRAYRETARNASNMNIGEGGWHTVNGVKVRRQDMLPTTWDGKDAGGKVMNEAWANRPPAQQAQARVQPA